MTEITFKLKDDLLKDYGALYIRDFLEKQLEYLKLTRTMTKIEEHVRDSGIDYEKALEDIRAETWEEYKKDFLH